MWPLLILGSAAAIYVIAKPKVRVDDLASTAHLKNAAQKLDEEYNAQQVAKNYPIWLGIQTQENAYVQAMLAWAKSHLEMGGSPVGEPIPPSVTSGYGNDPTNTGNIEYFDVMEQFESRVHTWISANIAYFFNGTGKLTSEPTFEIPAVFVPQ